ncbi:cobalt-precorrin-6A reductase [Defluviimonas aestuarii]|uniref:cobalt-precorrin-6A reductase n=1 Tax=Albidovulum aestuarii TaxID=1130726 RepID=UPI00249AE932|nr:cobalt-precorrin-6A reductase [Defluviimonas aestuarii]MDI3337502.1 cobalt-precorrin-6A reductase [Defluviimonas aestuarii]
MTRVLLLGGTSEASQLSRHFATHRVDAVFSYAGRTDTPVEQPLPTRVGGFGGADGLAAYLSAESITHVVDATHPFAAQMSRNAISACADTNTPLCAFERKPWEAGEGDDWTHVPDLAGAVAALPEEPSCIFLAIGRQNLGAFAVKPWHHYVLRLVDAPQGKLPLPDAEAVIARGPFTEDGDRKLLKSRRVNLIVAKNSGGSGARAKLDAARSLGLPVILIDRPALPPRRTARSVAEVMAFLAHRADLGV